MEFAVINIMGLHIVRIFSTVLEPRGSVYLKKSKKFIFAKEIKKLYLLLLFVTNINFSLQYLFLFKWKLSIKIITRE